jgi:hypothetical protein
MRARVAAQNWSALSEQELPAKKGQFWASLSPIPALGEVGWATTSAKVSQIALLEARTPAPVFRVIFVSMKIALAFILTALLAAPNIVLAQHKLDADGKQAMPYVKIAADVARNVQQDSLNNFLAIFISYRDSDQALQDDDLAPFMKVKKAKPVSFWSTVCFFSTKKDTAICIYFDEKRPFGVVALKAGPNGKLGDPADAYREVSRDMLAKNEHKLSFQEVTVQTDTGAGLTGFRVTAQ